VERNGFWGFAVNYPESRLFNRREEGEEPGMGRRAAAASCVPARRSFIPTSRSRSGASPARAAGRSGTCVHGYLASLAVVVWALPATVPPWAHGWLAVVVRAPEEVAAVDRGAVCDLKPALHVIQGVELHIEDYNSIVSFL
jgi:hypothetical protein